MRRGERTGQKVEGTPSLNLHAKSTFVIRFCRPLARWYHVAIEQRWLQTNGSQLTECNTG